MPEITTQTSASPSYLTTLRNNDRLVIPKVALRAIVFLFSIIAIGLLAGSITSNTGLITDGVLGASGIAPLGLVAVWTVIYILIQALRKSPPHPGFPVGFDLILWMALLIMGGFVLTEGIYGLIDPNDYGYDYNYCDNGSGDSGYGTDGSGTSSPYYGSNGEDPGYNSDCNSALTASAHRGATLETAGGVFMAIVGLIELALFIWACVDCARYNRSRNNRAAHEIASQVINQMVERGELVPARAPLMQGAAGAPVAAPPAVPLSGQYAGQYGVPYGQPAGQVDEKSVPPGAASGAPQIPSQSFAQEYYAPGIGGQPGHPDQPASERYYPQAQDKGKGRSVEGPAHEEQERSEIGSAE